MNESRAGHTPPVSQVLEEARQLVPNHRGMVIVDGNDIVIQWDDALASVLGWHSQEILGRPVVSIIPHEYRQDHAIGMRRFIASGEEHAIGKKLSLNALHKDTRLVPISLMIWHLPINGLPYFVARIEARHSE